MKNIIYLLILLIFITNPNTTNATDNNDIVQLTLEIKQQNLNGDLLPDFHIKLKNRTANVLKISPSWNYPAVLHADTEIHLFYNDNEISGIKACTNPSPLSEDEFIVIQPNQTIEFNLPTWGISFGKLAPGKYNAFATIILNLSDLGVLKFRSNQSYFNIN